MNYKFNHQRPKTDSSSLVPMNYKFIHPRQKTDSLNLVQIYNRLKIITIKTDPR